MAQHILRCAFLRKLEELAPEVLANLLDAVLPLFKRAASQGHPIRWAALQRHEGKSVNGLRRALLAWGRRYNLADDWLLDVALLTLFERVEWEDEAVERRRGGIPPTPEPTAFAEPLSQDIDCVPLFTFEHAGWAPQFETRARYKNAATKHFYENLTSYLATQEKIAQWRGFSRGLSKHAPGHFDWLVRWQVLARNWPALMAETPHRASRDSIREAVKRLAVELGVTQRRGRPGRPRATTASSG